MPSFSAPSACETGLSECGNLANPARSSIADDRHALNFDKHPSLRQSGNGNQCARRELAVRKHLAAQLDELVAIAGVLDKNGHGHQVLKASSLALQCAVH